MVESSFTNATSATALLIVDVQEDYLASSTLEPDRSTVTAEVARLLTEFRTGGAPVAHIRTAVSADGATAMPHRRAAPRCVEGTSGAATPAELTEKPGELVVHKQFFRGFVDPALDAWLIGHGVTRVVIAGLYTHACIRETALDAYERGFEVVIAAEAIGSDAPAHAAETLRWIGARAASVESTGRIIANLSHALISTKSDWGPRVRAAQLEWAGSAVTQRVALLENFAAQLGAARTELAALICHEVGKPITLARAEVDRAIEHIHSAINIAHRVGTREQIVPGVDVIHVPVGVIAAIMPWNNPLALPVSKIAPALLTGNAVLFKPSPFAAKTAEAVMAALRASGIPADLVTLHETDARASGALVRSPFVDAVTVTGSIHTGRQIARDCVTLGKPIQAELGGNNAAIVLRDADLNTVVPALAQNAFVFAGQRCTAVRRFIVHVDILEDFTARMVAALATLTPGLPDLDDTIVGPVLSHDAAMRIRDHVARAVTTGAQVVIAPEYSTFGGRHYVSPGLLTTTDPSNTIVAQETFGPVAVIQPASSLQHSIDLANGVEQGLVLFVCSNDPAVHAEINRQAQVGMLKFGADSLPVHPDAPFSGWKASGIGSPEHGQWDLEFYQRVRTQYA